MEELYLVRPSIEHKSQYEEMMDEWEKYGGRINPGALRRWSYKMQKQVSYEHWLRWIDEDREELQELYFLTDGKDIIGAITTRYKNTGVDGHTGYGIRPKYRGKGYATKMLHMAISILNEYGHKPIIVSCDKDNIASAKVILNNGGRFVEEIIEDDGNVICVYHIE